MEVKVAAGRARGSVRGLAFLTVRQHLTEAGTTFTSRLHQSSDMEQTGDETRTTWRLLSRCWRHLLLARRWLPARRPLENVSRVAGVEAGEGIKNTSCLQVLK